MTGTSHTVTGLEAATYYLDVVDVLGCETTGNQNIAVSQPLAPIAINYTFEQPSHTGGTNGSLTAAITGGTPK